MSRAKGQKALCLHKKHFDFAVLRKLRSNEAIRGISWGKIPFAQNIIMYKKILYLNYLRKNTKSDTAGKP
jgi:hypothetical protein